MVVGTRVRSERGTVDVEVGVDICKVVLETVGRLAVVVMVVEAGVRVEEASGWSVVDGVASIGVR